MLAPAFADPVLSSQAVFRAVMEATARPGTIHAAGTGTDATAPAPLGKAAAAVALTLVDYETPVWLDPALAQAADLAAWFRFHTGAPLVADPGRAAFAFIAAPQAMPEFEAFAQGSMEYPDRAATLVLQVDRLETAGATALRLSGPGIRGIRTLAATPLPTDFAARLRANRALFPRGVDIILAAGATLAALPRSVHVNAEPA
jgi:alpha-D-ribose 1-methylphosphonate 5-triphosphate synthase subunit PhnH